MYLNRRVQVPNRCAGPAQKDKEDKATDKMATEQAFRKKEFFMLPWDKETIQYM